MPVGQIFCHLRASDSPWHWPPAVTSSSDVCWRTLVQHHTVSYIHRRCHLAYRSNIIIALSPRLIPSAGEPEKHQSSRRPQNTRSCTPVRKARPPSELEGRDEISNFSSKFCHIFHYHSKPDVVIIHFSCHGIATLHIFTHLAWFVASFHCLLCRKYSISVHDGNTSVFCITSAQFSLSSRQNFSPPDTPRTYACTPVS